MSERFLEKPSIEADLSEEIAYTCELLEKIQGGVEASDNAEIKALYNRIKELLDSDQIRQSPPQQMHS